MMQTLNSLLTVHTDASSHLITKHIEEWNHQRDSTHDDGFFGMLNDHRRKLTASAVNAVIGTDPPQHDA